MKSKKPRRSLTIANSRWATYAVAGAATSLAGLSAAEGEIHYSGPVRVRFTGTMAQAFPLDHGANLDFTHSDEGGSGGIARMGLTDPSGEIGFFAADGGREASVSGFYLERIAPHVQVSQLPMEISCTSFSSTLRCFAATIGANFLSGGHFREPGQGYIAFSFDAGAGREYGWARIKTTGDPSYNFVLLDYAWADPGETIQTGQRKSRATYQAVSKSGSLGFLATGGAGLTAWRRHKLIADK